MYRAKDTFWAPDNRRIVKGDLVAPHDPVVEGREALFEAVVIPIALQRGQAAADPGDDHGDDQAPKDPADAATTTEQAADSGDAASTGDTAAGGDPAEAAPTPAPAAAPAKATTPARKSTAAKKTTGGRAS